MNRTDLLLDIIRARGYTSYLEIGVAGGENFHRIDVPVKVGVDPSSGAATYKGTSAAFFASNRDRFDLIFVDGDHSYDAVRADAEDALACLSPGGCLVLHDALPEHVEETVPGADPEGTYVGDVWRVVAELRQRPNLDVATVDSDHGCAVVFKRARGVPSAWVTRDMSKVWEEPRESWLAALNVIGEGDVPAFLEASEPAVKPKRSRKKGKEN